MIKERKELIVLDGLTILFIMMLVTNGVALAGMYRFHHMKVFEENLFNQKAYSDLLARSRELKNTIVSHEGAESWENSDYGKEFAFHARGKKMYETAGIALAYPSDYVSEVSEDGKHLTLMHRAEAERLRDPTAPAGDGPTTITVSTYPLDKKSVSEWVKTAPEANFNLGSGEYTLTKEGDIPATLYQWSGLYEAIAYAVEGKDGNVVLMTVTYITRGDDIVRDFDLILSTLRKT